MQKVIDWCKNLFKKKDGDVGGSSCSRERAISPDSVDNANESSSAEDTMD